MESNNYNVETMLNSLDRTNENILQAEKSPLIFDSSNSTIENIENFISEKFDQAAITHLKNQIISEINDIFKNQITNGSQIIDLQKHNSFLLNEVYFLREEVREKNFLIRNLSKRESTPNKCCQCHLDNNKEKHMTSDPLLSCENITSDASLSENQLNSILNSRNITFRVDRSKEKHEIQTTLPPLISIQEPSDHSQEDFLRVLTTDDLCVDNNSVSTKTKQDGDGDDEDEKEGKKKEKESGMQENSEENQMEKEERISDNDKNKNEEDKGHHTEQNKTNKKPRSSDEKSQKKVVILGDSIVKHLNGWEMTREIKNCKVKVMSFSGATVDCMTDYMKPSLRENPDHFIFHVGTNNLNSNVSARCIAESIVEKAMILKNEKHDVSISSILLRKDNLKSKADDVNNILKEICEEKNIFLIDHSKSIKQRHINRSKVHLNIKGSTVLGKTFVNHISNIFN